MAIQQQDVESTDTRSLDAIQRDITGLERSSLDQVTAELDDVRRRVHGHLSGFTEGGDAWRSIVDESEQDLDQHERAAIQNLEATRDDILRDRDQLKGLPYRPALPADQVRDAEAKASAWSVRLANMTAAQVAREVKGAVMFNDVPAMAAWALLAPDLESRFPPTEQVRDEAGKSVSAQSLFGSLLNQCEAKTSDRKVTHTRDKLEEQLVRINQRISEITTARAGHNPTGGVGSVLLNYQFGKQGGPEEARLQRRYDPEAVRTRLGRAK